MAPARRHLQVTGNWGRFEATPRVSRAASNADAATVSAPGLELERFRAGRLPRPARPMRAKLVVLQALQRFEERRLQVSPGCAQRIQILAFCQFLGGGATRDEEAVARQRESPFYRVKFLPDRFEAA